MSQSFANATGGGGGSEAAARGAVSRDAQTESFAGVFSGPVTSKQSDMQLECTNCAQQQDTANVPFDTVVQQLCIIIHIHARTASCCQGFLDVFCFHFSGLSLMSEQIKLWRKLTKQDGSCTCS